ncbi:MAG: antibiotic biosynthesis monooxygenase [Deltaproteobacteria bacterium]|nr:antibiotic biosynthesis monooxygenase [Deltaproteobacteria bacterium]
MIRVHIKRHVPEEKKEALLVFINQLRSITLGVPGYIAGETLKRVDKPGESLVVTKWRSIYYWNAWLEGTKRAEIQKQIDSLLGDETLYEIYAFE